MRIRRLGLPIDMHALVAAAAMHDPRRVADLEILTRACSALDPARLARAAIALSASGSTLTEVRS